MTEALASIVMVTYHTGPALWQAVKSSLRQSVPVEIIVVNNGNPTPVLYHLRRLADREPRITIISGQGNVGFARGCNLGAAQARAQHIAFINPDCVVDSGAIAAAGRALEENENAMLAGGLLLYKDGSEQRGSRRALLTPQNALVEGAHLHRFFPQYRLNDHETETPTETTEVPAISGAFMMLRRTDYARLGGLDEGYFLHVEDMDLCKRVADMGGKTLFVPGARIIHARSSSNAPAWFVEWHKVRGFVRYFYTHFRGEKYAWAMIPTLAVLATARAVVRVLLGKTRHG